MSTFIPKHYKDGTEHLLDLYITSRRHVPYQEQKTGLVISIRNAYKCRCELLSRMPDNVDIRWFDKVFISGVYVTPKIH